MKKDKDIIKGQALVYRAYCHYMLVQVWADKYKKGGSNSQLGVPLKLDNATGITSIIGVLLTLPVLIIKILSSA